MMQKNKNYYYFTVRDSLAECEVRVQEYWPENDREKFLDSEFREMYDSKWFCVVIFGLDLDSCYYDDIIFIQSEVVANCGRQS